MEQMWRALRDALDVLSPYACAGCSATGVAYCRDCEAELYRPLVRVDAHASDVDIPVWSTGAYAGPTRAGILAWKNGREDLDPHLERVTRELADRWVALEPTATSGLVVVPAPSGWQRRVRGRFVVGRMARWTADELGGVVADVLRRGRGPRHLAGLGVRARSRARRDVRISGPIPPGPVLLVDDVLTTGATLGACVSAVRKADPDRIILGALVLAATPRRSALG